MSDGSLKCWGDNRTGQLGDGTQISTQIYTDSTVDVTGITNAAEISTGKRCTCAVLSDGGVKCWGNNKVGQLGNGTVGYSLTPVDVQF